MSYRLTDEIRAKLKRPLGVLVSDLKAIEGGPVISVGDPASSSVIEAGLEPKICIYDGKSLRKEVGISPQISSYPGREVKVENPAGSLNGDVFGVIEEALSREDSTKIFVDGEEDLTALAAIQLAPNGSVVFYGQPGEGLVAVKVNEEKKKEVDEILEGMIEDGN